MSEQNTPAPTYKVERNWPTYVVKDQQGDSVHNGFWKKATAEKYAALENRAADPNQAPDPEFQAYKNREALSRAAKEAVGFLSSQLKVGQRREFPLRPAGENQPAINVGFIGAENASKNGVVPVVEIGPLKDGAIDSEHSRRFKVDSVPYGGDMYEQVGQTWEPRSLEAYDQGDDSYLVVTQAMINGVEQMQAHPAEAELAQAA